jgi:transcriptional regulator with XRE-family HTH domain
MTARRAEAGDAVVGRNIRLHRLARRMTQNALGKSVGVTSQQVQKYEKGVSPVGAARLARVATALNVPVAELIAGLDAPQHRKGSAPLALIAQPMPMRLIQAFCKIPDRAVRRGLMQLTEEIARATRRRAASR